MWVGIDAHWVPRVLQSNLPVHFQTPRGTWDARISVCWGYTKPIWYSHNGTAGNISLTVKWLQLNLAVYIERCRMISKLTWIQTPLILCGWVTHICASKLTIISSDNGLSPGWRQAIIWTNARISLIGPMRTNLSETPIEILQEIALENVVRKLAAILPRPRCVNS